MTGEVVGRLSDLSEGQLTPAKLGRAAILLTLADGQPRAVAARCPHQGAELSSGRVVDHVDSDGGCLVVDPTRPSLRCPWHGFEFDLATGDPVVPAPEHRRMRLRTFAVTVRGDDVVIEP